MEAVLYQALELYIFSLHVQLSRPESSHDKNPLVSSLQSKLDSRPKTSCQSTIERSISSTRLCSETESRTTANDEEQLKYSSLRSIARLE